MTHARVGTVVLLLAVILAGCAGPPPDANGGPPPGDDGTDGGNDTNDTTPPRISARFDGDRAFQHVRDQMRWPNGSTRYRIPNTSGNDAVAGMLVANWTELGWNASLDRFNGSDFLAADKHPTIRKAMRDNCDPAERSRLRNMSLHNVEATYGSGSREVLLTAHYDTKATVGWEQDDAPPVPGADDGASGVAMLWELARVLRGRTSNLTVTLVAFDAEDGWDVCYPSAGSTVYAETMAPSRQANVTAVVNLDMVGNASSTFPQEGYSRKGAGDVVDALWQVAARSNASMFRDRDAASVGDDHVPFLHEGMPAVDVIALPFPPYWHTTRDTIDKVDASTLQTIGRVIERFVVHVDRGDLGVRS